MISSELDECFDFVKNLVLRCGDVLREGYKNIGEVKTKTAAHDLVTFWDGEIEKILIDGIKEKYPDHRFIAEEETSATAMNSLTEHPTWIIDPIDGTINFVKKFHFFCISVAFVVQEDLKIAFLYNPILNEFYSARKGQGAFLNGEKIEVAKNENLNRCLFAHEISLGTVESIRPKYVEVARALLGASIGLRSFGSAALTLGYIAKGAIDAYSIEYLKPWDIAAGALLVQEAGGVVMDIKGGPFNIMRPDVIVAANQKLADEIKTIIDEVDQRLEIEGKLPRQLLASKNNIN